MSKLLQRGSNQHFGSYADCNEAITYGCFYEGTMPLVFVLIASGNGCTATKRLLKTSSIKKLSCGVEQRMRSEWNLKIKDLKLKKKKRTRNPDTQCAYCSVENTCCGFTTVCNRLKVESWFFGAGSVGRLILLCVEVYQWLWLGLRQRLIRYACFIEKE